MGKNIIVCCDGTDNQFGTFNTNVVRLFQCLDRSSGSGQVAYYDPGVGTVATPNVRTKIGEKLSYVAGMAFGVGIVKNVEEAIYFLSHHYEQGDKIFLIGFSRGAYTAKIIAGMLFKCGLPEGGADNLMPYITRMYRYSRDKAVNKAFKETFGRECPVHFLGLWDAVSTVGWIYNPVHFDYTWKNDGVATIRHAVAIDERRCFFRTHLWGEHPDKMEVWFPGVHSDVGGGYPEEESSLWKISFKWMVQEIREAGLKLDEAKVAALLGPIDENSWTTSPMHESLSGAWKICEFIPRRTYDKRSDSYHLHIPLSQSRFIADGALLHSSVLNRIRNNPTYRPKKISLKFVEEALHQASPAQYTPYLSK